MSWVYNDGGREAAGYRGTTGDCVCRSIAIVTGKSYREIYDILAALGREEKPRGGSRSHPRTGVSRVIIKAFMLSLGWRWVPLMKIGQGCKVHLRADELPKGRLLVSVSRHITAVIDGVIHDTHDPSRDGTRCVYGYFIKDK